METVTEIPGSLNQTLGKTTPVEKVCEKHNIQMWQIPSGEVICEKCEEEKKRVARELELQQREIKNKEEKALRAHKALALPKRLQKYSFENYIAKTPKMGTAVKSCKSFLLQWPDVGGMVMVGGVGTGKTHLAVSICKALCDKGVTCKIATVSQIIRRIKASWGGRATDNFGNTVSEEDIIDEYSSYSLLVIDEIGAQFGSDTERVMVTEIINNRYEQERPTIAIGNVSRSEMEELIGSRAVDRILHNGFLVVFNWKSGRERR